MKKKACREWDSNTVLLACESAALPNVLPLHYTSKGVLQLLLMFMNWNSITILVILKLTWN